MNSLVDRCLIMEPVVICCWLLGSLVNRPLVLWTSASILRRYDRCYNWLRLPLLLLLLLLCFNLSLAIPALCNVSRQRF